MRRILAVAMTVAIVASCGGSTATPSPGGGSLAPTGGASPSTAGGASPSTAGGASPSTAAWDPNAISGPVVLSGWQSSPDEGNALTQTLLAFQAKYPKIQVDYQPIAGDYRVAMITKFASKEVPDLFYVNADYSKEWIDQGFLAPLDDAIATSGFDTSQFFPGYASIFKGSDGKTYGLPKDGNTIALAFNSALVPNPPKTLDELITLAKTLKGTNGLKAPMCLNAGLDRGLAFLYAQGGSIVSDDGKTEQIDSAASKSAVQWYLDLFKNGLGMTASDLGSGWCGEALGKKQVAIIFEGGWLDPFMTSTYPDVKYTWTQVPTGSSGDPVTLSYTVSYAIGTDSKNKDAATVLLEYLTGPEGMQKWTAGGVALPSRKDVPTPTGKDVLTAASAFAKPGSGFMLGYVDIQKAFGDAFTAQLQAKTFDAGPVVTATAAAIKKALTP
jgi:multiple sugar transport system substrate-binding protein